MNISRPPEAKRGLRPHAIAFVLILLVALLGHVNGSTRQVRELPFDDFAKETMLHDPSFTFENLSARLPLQQFERHSVRSVKPPAHAIVGDIDGDGFDDLVLVYLGKHFETEFHVLINDRHGGFTEKTAGLGLGGIAARHPLGAALVDLRNRGWNDLLITTEAGELLVLENRMGAFPRVSRTIPLKGGDARTIYLADLDGDGFTDVIVSSYYQDIRDPYVKGLVSESGGRNFFLRNVGGELTEVPDFFPGGSRYTWALGISDFDGSGVPGIYEANDFGFDRYYALSGGKLVDSSAKSLGWLDSRSSMSAETADVHNEGRMDVFVANMPRPELGRGLNYLWMNESSPGHPKFRDRAAELGVDRCGFAWGSKFFDFDRDGRQDLFVVTSPDMRDDVLWRFQPFYGSFPPPLRFWLLAHDVRSAFLPFEVPIRDAQRNCVFHQRDDGGFEDVTGSTGMLDMAGGRGLALLDLKNDGDCAFAVANENATPGLFGCRYHGKNGWIGFRLTGTRSNRNAIGARVIVKTTRGTFLREVAPTNGYQGQSSLGLLFGIPADATIESVSATWPRGHEQRVEDWKLNAYNAVLEK